MLQHTNPALEGLHSTLKFNYDGEDLAKKRKQILEKIKLLLQNAQMGYKVNGGRCK